MQIDPRLSTSCPCMRCIRVFFEGTDAGMSLADFRAKVAQIRRSEPTNALNLPPARDAAAAASIIGSEMQPELFEYFAEPRPENALALFIDAHSISRDKTTNLVPEIQRALFSDNSWTRLRGAKLKIGKFNIVKRSWQATKFAALLRFADGFITFSPTETLVTCGGHSFSYRTLAYLSKNERLVLSVDPDHDSKPVSYTDPK
eukprot:SAG31_NODE_3915_length_3755_cov_1.358862_4_plen_202_part_00